MQPYSSVPSTSTSSPLRPIALPPLNQQSMSSGTFPAQFGALPAGVDLAAFHLLSGQLAAAAGQFPGHQLGQPTATTCAPVFTTTSAGMPQTTMFNPYETSGVLRIPTIQGLCDDRYGSLLLSRFTIVGCRIKAIAQNDEHQRE